MFKKAYMQGALDATKKFFANANPEHIHSAIDLAGLGLLSVPVAHHLATADNTGDRALAAAELGGLGVLGSSSIMKLRGH